MLTREPCFWRWSHLVFFYIILFKIRIYSFSLWTAIVSLWIHAACQNYRVDYVCWWDKTFSFIHFIRFPERLTSDPLSTCITCFMKRKISFFDQLQIFELDDSFNRRCRDYLLDRMINLWGHWTDLIVHAFSFPPTTILPSLYSEDQRII